MVELGDMDSGEKGGYILLLKLIERSEIRIGRLGIIQFNSGHYAYIGSAMGGLKQRISRHLRKEKKLHWHIDYLLEKALVENIIVCQSMERNECDIAGEIAKTCRVINGFGSSDCKCPGHLFYSPVTFGDRITRMLESVGMKPYLVPVNKDNSTI
jgi:sugar fermentation stimulation protein A